MTTHIVHKSQTRSCLIMLVITMNISVHHLLKVVGSQLIVNIAIQFILGCVGVVGLVIFILKEDHIVVERLGLRFHRLPFSLENILYRFVLIILN